MDRNPSYDRGQAVMPKNHVKILGVIMDSRLKYKQHIARASTKGLEAAMELKRLRTFFGDSKSTIHIHGGSAGRLRVECVNARISG